MNTCYRTSPRYKADPTGQYPLGIMEVVVDTGKMPSRSRGFSFLLFLGSGWLSQGYRHQGFQSAAGLRVRIEGFWFRI